MVGKSVSYHHYHHCCHHHPVSYVAAGKGHMEMLGKLGKPEHQGGCIKIAV